MRRLPFVLLLLAASLQTAFAATYTVTSTANSGIGTLRWAIKSANTHPGPDRVTFESSLAGSSLRPTGALLDVTDAETTIDGDLDDDSDPDIALDGSLLSAANGLVLAAAGTVVDGLAIVSCPQDGILIDGADGCVVRNCHLGVTLSGTSAAYNGWSDLHIVGSQLCIIGQPGKRNVISGGFVQGPVGIFLDGAPSTTIQNSYFGLNSAGTARLNVHGGIGIGAWPVSGTDSDGCIIRNNVFGGLYTGIDLSGCTGCTMQGNYFGLGANGTSGIPIFTGIRLVDDASGNRIGGTTAAARNVFAGNNSAYGVWISGPVSHGNRVRGNYFGLNAPGTARKPLLVGVQVDNGAGAQTIGGSTAACGNYFASSTPSVSLGIYLNGGGSGSDIRRNRFGQLANGSRAWRGGTHIDVLDAQQVKVRDNMIEHATVGVRLTDNVAPTSANLFGNTFSDTLTAVDLWGAAAASLGNLGNASTSDDGGNQFLTSNVWHIRNQTGRRIRAEGNGFGTTVKHDIDAKIHDKLDDPARGRVDFIPLIGGVIPTGEAGLAALAVTGAAAIPAAGGAEIVFTLSSPADVTVQVLAIAGRPIATLPTTTEPAGLQRVLWTGHTGSGLAAPAGRYLVRITARNEDGAQANALTTLALRR